MTFNKKVFLGIFFLFFCFFNTSFANNTCEYANQVNDTDDLFYDVFSPYTPINFHSTKISEKFDTGANGKICQTVNNSKGFSYSHSTCILNCDQTYQKYRIHFKAVCTNEVTGIDYVEGEFYTETITGGTEKFTCQSDWSFSSEISCNESTHTKNSDTNPTACINEKPCETEPINNQPENSIAGTGYQKFSYPYWGDQCYEFTCNEGFKFGSYVVYNPTTCVPINSAPEISDQDFFQDENEIVEFSVVASNDDANEDGDEDSIFYQISGDDAFYFTIDSSTGKLKFNDSPDFEDPKDGGKDNVYTFVVSAEDIGGAMGETPLSNQATITVTVMNVDENSAPVANSDDFSGSPFDLTAGDFDLDVLANDTDSENNISEISGIYSTGNSPDADTSKINISDSQCFTVSKSHSDTKIEISNFSGCISETDYTFQYTGELISSKSDT